MQSESPDKHDYAPINASRSRVVYAYPFQQTQFYPTGFLRRLFGLKSPNNSLIELINTFAKSSAIDAVTLETISDINRRYKVDLHTRYGSELETLYRKYILYCFDCLQLAGNTIDNIFHLKSLFAITDEKHNAIYLSAGTEFYKKSLKEALADDYLSEQEKSFLNKLANDLEIPDAVKESINGAEAKKIVEQNLTALLSNSELSPAEEEECNRIALGLGVKVKFDQFTTERLNKMRLLWRVKNASLLAIPVPLTLQSGEECYFTSACTWNEVRKKTVGVAYNGITMRTKIISGVYLRSGIIGGERITREEMTMIDAGMLYVTNKRLLFMGQRRNIPIRLKNILDMHVYSDGLVIQRDTGRMPYLYLQEPPDVCAAYISRVLLDYGS